MDMSRLDRSAARPLGGLDLGSLREQPELPPAPGERPLREPDAAGDVPVITLRTPLAEDHTTTAELLLILREVLGEEAVGPADGPPAAPRPLPQPLLQPVPMSDVLLLDQPLLDQTLLDQPLADLPRGPRPPAIDPATAAAEHRPRITVDAIDDDLAEAPVFGREPGTALTGFLRAILRP